MDKKRPPEKRIANPADRIDHESTADDDDELAPDEIDDDVLEAIAADDDRLQD
jgi:hypothetical protein